MAGVNTSVQGASTTGQGLVKLAGNTNAVTGTSAVVAVTPDDLKAVLGHDYTYPIEEIVEYSNAQ